MIDTETTQRDVALDVAAALGMYDGLCGSDSTTIDQVDELPRDTLRLELSDGSVYELRVREAS